MHVSKESVILNYRPLLPFGLLWLLLPFLRAPLLEGTRDGVFGAVEDGVRFEEAVLFIGSAKSRWMVLNGNFVLTMSSENMLDSVPHKTYRHVEQTGTGWQKTSHRCEMGLVR